MSVTGEFTNPEKWLPALTYLPVQGNHTLTTQVLMPHSYGSTDKFHETYCRTQQNTALDKMA